MTVPASGEVGTPGLLAARRAPASLGDGWMVAAAVATWAGALVAVASPWPLGLGAALAGLVRRWPVVLVAGLAVAASGLGAAAWSGLDPPSPRPVQGWATLVSDPRPAGPGWRVDLRLADGSRHRAWAYGGAAFRLQARLAGEQVLIDGRLRPASEEQRRWLAPRHLAGSIAVERIDEWRPGNVLDRAANRLRRLLERGAAPLPERDRALLTGLTVGDDRHVPAGTEADFRAAGLTHLLAVSGQNVAFVLALAGPVVGRAGLRARLVGLAMVLVLFGTLTRWEPSVLRATVMAAVAVGSVASGRSSRGLRSLALAVSGLVLVDPLLVRSAGFQLSVGASAGIALLAPPLAARLPGPRAVAHPLAVTLAAQAGVALPLLAIFGWLPVASVPANLLAGPAAGPVMAWGLVGGLAAGVVGDPWAAVIHVPTRLLVGWIAGVAEVTANLPGEVTQPVVAVGLALALGGVLAGSGGGRLLLVAGAAAALVVPALLAPARHHGDEVSRGARLWRADGSAVLTLAGADPPDVVAALRRHRVASLDLVVATGARDASAVAAVLDRVEVGAVVGPLPGAHHPGPGFAAVVGRWVVTVDAGGAQVRQGSPLRSTGDGRSSSPGAAGGRSP